MLYASAFFELKIRSNYENVCVFNKIFIDSPKFL